jgi:hypothetical protein
MPTYAKLGEIVRFENFSGSADIVFSLVLVCVIAGLLSAVWQFSRLTLLARRRQMEEMEGLAEKFSHKHHC